MTRLIFDRRVLGSATLSAIAMVAAFIASFAWLENRVAALLDGELHASLQHELALFQTLRREGGHGALLQALDRRLSVPHEPRMLLLLDPQGHAAVGRLQDWPGRVLDPDAPEHLAAPGGETVLVVSGDAGDGFRLFVGQRDLRHDQLGRSITTAAVVAMLVVLATGLGVGLQFNSYLLARLAGIAQAAREIMRGQMQARAPEGQRLDALGSLARTFNEMLDQNEALVTGMRTATESLAHDLRTPLMRLRRAIESARFATSPAERDEHLARAEAEAEHTLRTFGALIDLARAEAGLSRDAMERTDLAALATDVADLFEPLAEERGQRLERDIRPASAVAHRQILFQALVNLLENAVKYSPPGSPLRLRLEPGDANQGPAFVVTDAGPGIPVHAREQVLRPFVRLENADRKPGSGLGLAIAAAAARLHGGKVLLEDAAPGLAVRLQLGVERRDPGAPPGTGFRPGRSADPKKVARSAAGA